MKNRYHEAAELLRKKAQKRLDEAERERKKKGRTDWPMINCLEGIAYELEMAAADLIVLGQKKEKAKK